MVAMEGEVTVVLLILCFVVCSFEIVVGQETEEALIGPLLDVFGIMREECGDLEELVQLRYGAQVGAEYQDREPVAHRVQR